MVFIKIDAPLLFEPLHLLLQTGFQGWDSSRKTKSAFVTIQATSRKEPPVAASTKSEPK
jgi:hypothetical protein